MPGVIPLRFEEESMRRETRRKYCLVVIAALLIAGGACSLAGLTKGKGIAEAAVEQFHNQYNAGQFHEIYEQADEEFKKSTSETDFASVLEALRRKLGTVKQSEQSGWQVNATPIGTMVTLGYGVDFSEGKGSEQFVFRISDDKARLYNYNVNSPLLITK